MTIRSYTTNRDLTDLRSALSLRFAQADACRHTVAGRRDSRLLGCRFKQDTAERLHTPRHVRRHSRSLPDDDAPTERLISTRYRLVTKRRPVTGGSDPMDVAHPTEGRDP